ncbi:MAG: glycoside hydrolase family 28 protein [Phycisphaerae bacterium]
MRVRVQAIAVLMGMCVAGSVVGAEPRVVSISSLGAVGDGKTPCTEAIAKAMDQLGEAGGVVEVPAGKYLTGAIRLKSNITLQVDEGATLLFSTDPKDYPLTKTRYEGVEVMNYSPLISAVGAHDVKITGKGTLDGQGEVWWKWARSFGRKAAAEAGADENAPKGANSGQGVGGSAGSRALMLQYTADREGKFPVEQRVFGEEHPGFRPCFIEPWECKNVTIEGVTVRQSPFWNLHPVYCDGVVVKDVTVYGNGPNTDGCDPDSCKNVTIEGCRFETGDDCIAIKSGRDGDGLRVNRPTENIVVRNCEMTSGHGGIAIGSETSGGVKHVVGENCRMEGVDWGIRIKSARGRGGVDEDFVFRKIDIRRAKKGGVTVNLMYGSGKNTVPVEAAKDETTPTVKDVHLEDVTCAEVPEAMLVVGLPESHIEGLTLKNVRMEGKKGASVSYVDGFSRENVEVKAKGLPWVMKEVEEK